MRTLLTSALLMGMAFLAFAQHQPINIPPVPSGAKHYGLDPNKAITEYMYSVWQTEQGLPHNFARALCQTRDGYLWIGTREGLARFDGVNFTVFDKSNTPAIRNNFITALLEDREGGLWIGTNGGGVSRLFQGQMSVYTTEQGLSNDFVRSLMQDHEGKLWIGTQGGVNCLHQGKIRIYSTKQGLSNNIVLSLLETRGHSSEQRAEGSVIWIGTDNGLNRLYQEKINVYTTKEGLSNNIALSLLEDREGALWIGTWGGGVNRFFNGRFNVYDTKQGLSNNFVWSLLEDRSGAVWMGTEGGGINRLYQGQIHSYGTKQGLSNGFVYSLLEDREGALWIGTSGGGVSRLYNGQISVYGTKQGLSNDIIFSLLEDPNHNNTKGSALWMGTRGGGVNCLYNGRVSVYTTKQGLSNNVVWALLSDRSGALWVGTQNGLNRLYNGRVKVYNTEQGLSHSVIRSLLETRNGDKQGGDVLWVGTGGGLDRIEHGKVSASYTTQQGLSDNSVVALLEDRQGALWVGTGEGLNRLEHGKIQVFSTKQGLSHDLVSSLLEDSDGILWIGTEGGGLNRLKNGKLSAITTAAGLFSDVVYCILEDDVGYFWMSCNKGIFRARKADVNAFLDGNLQQITCTVLGGAGSIHCNGGGQPAGWKGSDGRLYFPTMTGVAAINPKNISSNILPPPVIIEEIKADNTMLNLNAAAELPATIKKIEFHYTATSLTASEKVRFKYLLEGYDKDWVEAAARRTAYYTALPRGHTYRFRVIACNDGGIWNETGATAIFSLAPYFWETWWFYGLCTVFVLGSGYGTYRWRVHYIHERAEVLERVVEERTHDLHHASHEIQRQMKFQAEQAQEIEVSNKRLHEANEEIQQQLEIQAEQAREIELANAELQQAYENLTILSRIGQHITATLDLEKILTTVYSAVNELMDASVFGIGICNDEEQTIEYNLAIQNGKRFLPYKRDIRDKNQLPVWCMENKRTVFINDLANEFKNYISDTSTVNLVGILDDDNDAELPISLLYQPLVVEGRVLGVITVQSFRKNAYMNHHLEILGTLATYTAVALDNARLYEERTHRAAELHESNERLNTTNALFSDANAQILAANEEIQRQLETVGKQAREIQLANLRLQEKNHMLEQLDKEKNEFLGIVAHDLKNPLSGIMMTLSLVEKHWQDLSTQDVVRRLRTAQEMVSRMKDIISHLLNINAIETGNVQFSFESFYVVEAITSVIAEYQERAATKNITIHFAAESDGVAVYADKNAVIGIFDNLISNALKYSPADKNVWVIVKEQGTENNEPDSALKPVDSCLILVKDEGPGLSEEDMKQLFGKFARLSAQPTGGEDSTGLGLAIVKKLVEAMNGHVWCESELGHGSTFIVKLPLVFLEGGV